MERSEAIEQLKGLRKLVAFDKTNFEALTVAIDSLEVDEAYQLEYEKAPERQRGDAND